MKRLAVAIACLLLVPSAAQAQELRAGVGRADITPPTGYVLGGWVRADRTGEGVHTRLNATALVLQRGDKRVALVSADLFMIPGGLLKEAAERAGFSEDSVLASASHTHGGPTGFANFRTYNTTAPSIETIDRPETFVKFFDAPPPDPQLYTFLVERFADALREAAKDMKPALAGWGETKLADITKNRSVEAHLNNHGIVKERGAGSAEEDPAGVEHTIDPEVHVLRVDQMITRTRKCGPQPKRRFKKRAARWRACKAKPRRITERVPVGGWSSFANHGTVNPSEYEVYNRDHHGAAVEVFEQRVRAAGKVPPDRLVVNVYGNSNEGDQSAGLDARGPEHAEDVGRREANAMFEAWENAGGAMSEQPDLDLRWTRTCFCGQEVEGGKVASEPVAGLPFLTGSEEGRGPLYDVTMVPLEGVRNPTGFDSQGHKAGVPGATSTETVPKAVPLMTVRIADRVIASVPAEPTVEVGRRIRVAVQEAMRGDGVNRVIVSGLANEFIQYLVTPEEYDRQHYEGGSALYGRLSSVLVTQELAELADRMARGKGAQGAYPFDPRNGVKADGAPFGAGAESGTIEAQPTGGTNAITWRGGEKGLDRPLDTPFVTVERQAGKAWERHADDLGIDIVWKLDEGNRYTATWNVPDGTPAGTYRFVITANRYRLESAPFQRG